MDRKIRRHSGRKTKKEPRRNTERGVKKQHYCRRNRDKTTRSMYRAVVGNSGGCGDGGRGLLQLAQLVVDLNERIIVRKNSEENDFKADSQTRNKYKREERRKAQMKLYVEVSVYVPRPGLPDSQSACSDCRSHRD